MFPYALHRGNKRATGREGGMARRETGAERNSSIKMVKEIFAIAPQRTPRALRPAVPRLFEWSLSWVPTPQGEGRRSPHGAL